MHTPRRFRSFPPADRTRGRRRLRAVLAQALPRRMVDLGIEVDYVEINVRPPRFIDAHIRLS